jgi:peptide/nickel transport system substrate-binding protein
MNRRMLLVGLTASVACALSLLLSLTSFAGTRAAPRTIDRNATIVIAYPQEVTRFDPRLPSQTYFRNVQMAIFDGLVEKNYFNPSKPLDIQPALATSWTVSKDRRTYTFQLRRGVRFHDGTLFNAQSVVFTFRSIIDKSFAYYCAECNAASFRDNQIIDSVHALGGYRVAITLKEPFFGFLDTLSSNAQFDIVSPTAVQKLGNAGFNQRPVGTGYVKFVEAVPGQRIVLERNDQYFRGPVTWKRLVILPITDPVARANALQAGEANIAEDISITYKQAWAGRKNVRVIVNSRARRYSCFFNYRGGGPTTKKAVRQALSLSADRGAMNVVLYAKLSNRSNGWYTPGTPPYDPAMPPLAYNLKNAKALLTQAGYGSGLTVRLEVAPTAADDQKILAIWQQSLKQVGVELKLQNVDVPTWNADFFRGMKPYPDGPDGTCILAGLDVYWAFAQYAGKAGYPEVGGYNPGYYTNPQAEAAFARAKNSTSTTQYFKALADANKIITNDYGLIFMLVGPNIAGIASNVDWKPGTGQQHWWYTAKVYKK